MEKIIEKQVMDVLKYRLTEIDLDFENIDKNKSLLQQGVYDSMSFLEFIIKIESLFNIEIDFGELNPTSFTSLDGIINIIRNKLNE